MREDLKIRLERFREQNAVDEAVRGRIVRPAVEFIGDEILEQAVSALLQGENLLLCGGKATGKNILADNLAWLKYDLGWLLPTVMIVISVGMLCTELTETAAGVFVQAAWWFISLMTGATGLSGGNYGWNLIPRHNTEMNYAGFASGFRQLAEMNEEFD